jgi:hypothetical protein
MNINNINKYEHTFHEYDLTIPGYFGRKDLLLFNSISNIQKMYGLIQNAFEIGIYFGRGTIHLSNLDYINVIGVDLFDIQLENISQSGLCDINTYTKFLENVNKYGCIEKIKIIRDNSLNLINNKYENISFYHIDGGHSFSECFSDLMLCEHNKMEQTIICIDDAFHAMWPNVSAAIAVFVYNNPVWKAFLISDNKLYLCQSKYYNFYYSNIKQMIPDELNIFTGHKINYLNSPIVKV